MCRERRIKCDETKPACLKCIRSGRSCSGYSHGLKLRDQTQKTIIKAKLGKTRGRRQGNSGQERGKSPISSSKTASSTSSTENSPTNEPVRPRSFSLASRSVPTTGGGGFRGHRRCSSGSDAKCRDLWSLNTSVVGEATADSLLWKMIDIPLIVS